MRQRSYLHTNARVFLLWTCLLGVGGSLPVLVPDSAVAVDNAFKNQLRTARRLLARQQPEEAIKVLNVAFRKHPYDVRAISLYVDALLRLERYEEAEETLGKALVQPDVDQMALHRTRVNLYLAQEKWDKALEDVVQTMILSQDMTEWGFKVCHNLIKSGLDASAARRILDEALQGTPDNADLPLLGSIMTALDGDAPEALRQVLQIDRQWNAQGRVLLKYSEHMVSLGFRAEAKTAIETAAREAVKPSRRSQVLFLLSDLLQEDGRYEEALTHLATIAQERDGTSTASKALMESAAIYREKLDDCVRALAVYDRLEDDPSVGHHLPELLLEKAECQIRVEDFEEAMATYDKVFPEALDPEQAERAAYGKANSMFFAGQIDSALTLYQDMAEAYPRSLKTDDAAQHYIMLNANKALGGGDAMAMMGRLEWAVAVNDSAAIAKAAEELIGAYPGSSPAAAAWMALGALAERYALYSQAVGYYEKIARDFPGDRRAPLALKREGDLLVEQLNKPEAALEKLERILTDYPNSIVAGETRRLVEKIRSVVKS